MAQCVLAGQRRGIEQQQAAFFPCRNVTQTPRFKLRTRRLKLGMPRSELWMRHLKLRTPRLKLRMRHLKLRTPRLKLRMSRLELRMPHSKLRMRRLKLRTPRFALRMPRYRQRIRHSSQQTLYKKICSTKVLLVMFPKILVLTDLLRATNWDKCRFCLSQKMPTYSSNLLRLAMTDGTSSRIGFRQIIAPVSSKNVLGWVIER
jgi:hypothetical protein